jgi:hypothetical protein
LGDFMAKAKNKAKEKPKKKGGCWKNLVLLSFFMCCGITWYYGENSPNSSRNNGSSSNQNNSNQSNDSSIQSSSFGAQSSSRNSGSFSARTVYAQSNGVRVRECPERDCDIVDTLESGESVRIVGQEEGESVSGNSTWYETADGYVHSSTVGNSRPAANSAPAPTAAPVTNNTSGGGSSSNSGGSGGDASRRPANCAEAVAWGYTAQQAAQWSHLDRDGDGVACYGD